MFHKRVGIPIQRYRGVFMPQYLRQCFHVHSALQSACSERMPKWMEAFTLDMQTLLQKFKGSLIRSHRRRFTLSDSTTYSEMLFLLYSFRTGSNCFGSGIILLEEVVFGKSVIRQRFPFSSRPSWQVLFTVSVPFVKSISAQVSASSSPIRNPE